MKVPKFKEKPENEESEKLDDVTIELDKNHLFMLMANPYMKAVKHDEAAKEANKNKKPI